MSLLPIPWYLPTMYGDVRLTAQGKETEVEWEGLSPSEEQAMKALCKKFKVTPPDFASIPRGSIWMKSDIEKVEATLASAMKKGRKLLSAVVFKNGRIEEIHRGEEADEKRDPYREPAAGAPEPPPPAALAEVPKAAVTVPQPTIGCPCPEFERADLRATRVLRAFLTPPQLEDFERTQSFIVEGGDTGRRYLLTSRQAPRDRLAKVDGRSVFDLSGGYPVCVHDWTVPAAEELLELKLFLEIPGKEKYVRSLPEAFTE